MTDRRRNPKHIHKYMLRNQGRNKVYLVYACMKSDCLHYIPAEKAVGLDTVCWVCGNVCQVPKMRRERYIKRPHCVSCTKEYIKRLPVASSTPVDLKKLAEMTIDELLGDEDLFNPDKKKEH